MRVDVSTMMKRFSLLALYVVYKYIYMFSFYISADSNIILFFLIYVPVHIIGCMKEASSP